MHNENIITTSVHVHHGKITQVNFFLLSFCHMMTITSFVPQTLQVVQSHEDILKMQ